MNAPPRSIVAPASRTTSAVVEQSGRASRRSTGRRSGEKCSPPIFAPSISTTVVAVARELLGGQLVGLEDRHDLLDARLAVQLELAAIVLAVADRADHASSRRRGWGARAPRPTRCGRSRPGSGPRWPRSHHDHHSFGSFCVCLAVGVWRSCEEACSLRGVRRSTRRALVRRGRTRPAERLAKSPGVAIGEGEAVQRGAAGVRRGAVGGLAAHACRIQADRRWSRPAERTQQSRLGARFIPYTAAPHPSPNAAPARAASVARRAPSSSPPGACPTPRSPSALLGIRGPPAPRRRQPRGSAA